MAGTAIVAGAGALGALVAFGPLGPAVALGIMVWDLAIPNAMTEWFYFRSSVV